MSKLFIFKKISLFTFFFFLFVWVSQVHGLDYEGKILEEINVLSNKEPERRILAFLDLEEGLPVNKESIRNAFKSLYEIGIFKDLKFDLSELESGNLKLDIIVSELSRIRDVRFVGNQKFTDEELTEDVSVRSGDYFTETLINQASDQIKDKYREEGYLMTRVFASEEMDAQTGEVDLVLDIDEGQEMLVGKINFHGVKNIKEKKLRKVMETTEDKAFKEGIFNDATFEEDKIKMLLFYQSEGYVNAKIEDIKISYRWKKPRKKRTRMMQIDIWIDEGEMFYFGHLLIKGNKLFTKEELYYQIRRDVGTPYNEAIHQQDIEAITMMYHQRGYIFARVTPVETRDEERRIIHHVLDIYEGDKAHVERIFIEGHEKTKDFVILRELRIREGEIFDREKVQRSQERLMNTQYFESVVPEPKPGSVEGLMNLVFRVREQRTGLLSAGAGFGTQSGFSLNFRVQEQNFLGRGQTLGADVNLGTIDQIGSINFTEPYLFDKEIFSRISLRVGVERRERSIDNLPEESTTSIINNVTNSTARTNFFDLTIPDEGRPGENRNAITYRNIVTSIGLDIGYRFKEWYQVSTGILFGVEKPYWSESVLPWNGNRSEKGIWNEFGGSDGSGFFKSDEEKEEETGLDYENGLPKLIYTARNSFSFQVDTRDNRVTTTRGMYFDFDLSATYGSFRYSRWAFQYSYYKTPLWKFVLVGNHQLEVIGDLFDSRITQMDDSRLLQLRREELRGWSPDNIRDHRDKLSEINKEPSNLYEDFINPIGRSKLLSSIELRFPFFQQLLWGVFFMDMGNISSAKFFRFKGEDARFNGLWLMDPRNWMYSIGTGFRIEMPQFPIRLYLSWKFYYDWEKKEVVWPDFGNGAPEFTFNVLGFF